MSLSPIDRHVVTIATENEKRQSQQSISALDNARRIVLEHGWNSTSYQILNPGIQRWFARANDGVTGFVSYRGVRVAAGAPVCAEKRLRDVAAEFERDAVRAKASVCYFCAEARLEYIYANSSRHSKVLLGAQPVWKPQHWSQIVAKQKSLRAQFNRARNKGVTISEWPVERARDHPALIDCLRRWLAAKGLPTMHFLVEPDTLSRLFDRRVFVAERGGEVIGFVLLSPVPTRNGWLFEQFVHRPGSPNGTVELMIDTAMRSLATSGCDYATLGLSPLSTRAEIPPFENPLWLRALLAWMRAHGKRFYNFEGLDSFKTKFRPERWEPVFAISSEPLISPGTLYAIAAAFSGGSPIGFLLSGLWRAFLTEIKWLWRGAKRKLLK